MYTPTSNQQFSSRQEKKQTCFAGLWEMMAQRIALRNLSNQAGGACLRPYNNLFNRQTCFAGHAYREGGRIYTVSLRSPCKNAFLTSIFQRVQLQTVTTPNKANRHHFSNGSTGYIRVDAIFLVETLTH